MSSFDESVAKFKARLETEREWCEQLYRDLTVRLLAHKYAYYVESKHFIDDFAYDGLENSWRIMGTALGYLAPGDISPCIDFDYNHPLANEGIELARSLKTRKI